MYELRYGDYSEQSEDLQKLKLKAKRTNLPWAIFKFECSKVDAKIKEMELFGNDGVEALIKDVKRGIPLTRLALKYHTSTPTLTKYIVKYKAKYETLK